MEASWDGPHTMPRHRSLLAAFSTPGDAPVCVLMELPLERRGAAALARRLQGFILPPL
jgi:hypothetical protein